MSSAVHRRSFLKQTAAAGGLSTALWMGQSSPLFASSPNEKLNLACVGVGNKGRHNVDQLKSQNIVALCDVDERYLGSAAEAHPKANRYRDYRKMFDKEGERIDAVVVSTADHMHAPVASIALDLGKHVYCEKPLAHTVAETRALTQLAKKNKCVTQMGTQIHASENYRRVVELVQGGAIGKVSEVYNWCNKNWADGRFGKPIEKPDFLDWDLWLGAAKKRPYCDRIHPANWRRFWEYGSGTFGDMACHIMDLSFWAMKLRYPVSVKCEGPEVHPVGTAAWVKATYEFERDDEEPLKYYWSDGGKHFDKVKETLDHGGQPLSRWGLGVLFVGDRGMLAADYGRRQLLPQDKFDGFEPPAATIKNSIGHWNEWVEACKTGGPTTCNFEYSGALTESVLLGIVAFRTQEKLSWDADALQVTNSDKANQLIGKEYRKGFEVVGLDAIRQRREPALQR